MSILTIRSATPADLPEIKEIEKCCFSSVRRTSLRALKYSLKSPSQSVWLAVSDVDGQAKIAAAMILYHHRLSLRIYSVAVLPAFRGSGVGRRLIHHAIALARENGRSTVLLEADSRDKGLTSWYESFGFQSHHVFKHYYSQGWHAVRMRLSLKPALKGGRVRGCS